MTLALYKRGITMHFTPKPETLAEYGPRPCPFDWPEMAGVYVGGCIDGGGRFRRQAHAHNYTKDQHFGWVCVLSHRKLFGQTRTPDGVWVPTDRPSQLMLHEYAHILTPNHGHDEVWMLAAYRLGYRFQAHEKSRAAASWTKFQTLKKGQR